MPKRSSLDVAIGFLRHIIETSDRNALVLPSTRILAKRANLSVSTMRKAMSRLKEEGILEGVRGQRCRIPRNRFADSELQEPPSVQLDLAGRIGQDVLNGVHRWGEPLGSCKTLQTRYGVSFPTLHAALARLSREGLLVKGSRTWFVGSIEHASVRSQSPRIVVIAEPEGAGSAPSLGILEESLIRSIEMQCAHAGLRLTLVSYIPGTRGATYMDVVTKRQVDFSTDDSVAGYIVLCFSLFYSVTQILTHLDSVKKPVAIIDETGNVVLDKGTIHNVHRFRIFSYSTGSEPGADMARYFLSIGHRRLAFISPFHAHGWSKLRAGGVCRICSAACAEAIVIAAERDASHYTVKWSESRIRRLVEVASREVRKSLAEPLVPFFDEDIPRIWQRLELNTRTYETLKHLFEKAYDSRATAWICANDLVARLAKGFAHSRGIAMPEAVSIAGFDDQLSSAWEGLTSYNFNISSAVNSAIAFVTDPRRTSSFRAQRTVSIQGYVVPRMSSSAR